MCFAYKTKHISSYKVFVVTMLLCLDKSAADGPGDAADTIPCPFEEHIGTVTGKRHQQLFYWACTPGRGEYTHWHYLSIFEGYFQCAPLVFPHHYLGARLSGPYWHSNGLSNHVESAGVPSLPHFWGLWSRLWPHCKQLPQVQCQGYCFLSCSPTA